MSDLESSPPAEAEPPTKRERFERIDKLLSHYMDEFHKIAANPHTPSEEIAHLLAAIHGLRVEKQIHRP
jgi:phosphoglycolate phosphatase-like HAD superfamily hydrolase